MNPIIALKPGRFLDSSGVEREFTESDLQATADAYSVELHEAPITIGHPKDNAPAFGWIRGVRLENGELQLIPDQINPDFAEMVRAGAFKKHSIALYPPDDPRNPKPGVWYPRHIGFLGAQPPAIKGLPAAEFDDGDDWVQFDEIDVGSARWSIVRLFRGLRDYLIERDGRESADDVLPAWTIDQVEEAFSMDENDRNHSAHFSEEDEMTQNANDLAAREAELKKREQRIQQQEKAAKDAAATRRREGAVQFAEQLADSGRILPRHKDRVAEILTAIDGDEPEEIEFAEGSQTVKKTSADALREFLLELPEQVNFSEKSGKDTTTTAAQFSAPSGTLVDPARAEHYNRARAYQREHNCDFAEAAAATENP